MSPRPQTIWTPALPLSYTCPHLIAPSSIEIVEGPKDHHKVEDAVTTFAEHNQQATPFEQRDNVLKEG